MSAYVNLTAIAGNDESWDVVVTYDSDALDLSTYTPTIYLKRSASSLDSTAKTYTTSSGLTLTDSSAGEMTWAVAASDVAGSSQWWYRLDVTDSSGNVATCVYGHLTLVAV